MAGTILFDPVTISLLVFWGEIFAKASLAFFHSGFSNPVLDLVIPGGSGTLSPGTGGSELYCVDLLKKGFIGIRITNLNQQSLLLIMPYCTVDTSNRLY